MDMNIDHEGVITKTRCPALTDRVLPKPGRDVADTLADWLQGAPAREPQPVAIWQTWKGTPEAIIWAMEQGAYADEATARAALKAALQRVYPGRDSCKPHELPAVLDAFHADVLSQPQKEPAA
jgi:hypothetical protein